MDKAVPTQVVSPSTGSMADAVHAVLAFFRVLRYRVSYIVIALLVTCLLGSLYYATSTRLYEARASLLVIPNGTDAFNPNAPVDRSQQALIPTYVQLFYEDVVLDRAVEYLADQPAARKEFRDVPTAQWAGHLRENLSADRERRTNLIYVAYRSRSREAAEAVVEAVDRAYLDFIDKNHRDVSAEIVRILDQERADIEERLNNKHRELLEAKRQTGDLGLPENSQAVHPVVQRVLSLNEELIAAEQKRLDMRATLAAVEVALQSGGDLREHLVAVEPVVGRELLMGLLGLSPQNTEVLSRVEQDLIDDRARLDKLLRHYGDAHPDVIQARRTIAEGERYLADYQRQVQSRLSAMSRNQLGPMLTEMIREKLEKLTAYEQELRQRYRECEAEAVQLTDRLVQASIIENEVQRLRHLHDTLLNRIAGIDISESQASVRVTVASDPVAGARPVSPRLLLTALISVFAGLVIGVATVYVLDLLDDRFRSPDEITQQLGTPLLGIVGALPSTDARGLDAVHAFVSFDSAASEAFRTLRTTIAFCGRAVDCMSFTSAEPGDGKTTVLVNLGVICARAGRRTLLIDADMRRPGLSRLLDVRGIRGLSQLLQAVEPVAESAERSICTTQLTELHVLPCGSRPHDPVDLLTSTRFAELLAWAGSRYDQVLIDCPPVMAASDAAIVGRQVDGVALVLQPEKNNRRLVLRAAESLRSMQVPLIGVVANRVGSHLDSEFLSKAYGYDSYEEPAEEEDKSDIVVPIRRRAA